MRFVTLTTIGVDRFYASISQFRWIFCPAAEAEASSRLRVGPFLVC
jgi:hypothetical protein